MQVGPTFLIWMRLREAIHWLPAPQVNSYTPSSHATRAVVRGPYRTMMEVTWSRPVAPSMPVFLSQMPDPNVP